MIKRVSVSELKVGMYIQDLGADWSAHPFLRSSFPLKADSEIETIIRCGMREVYIDTDRGLDVADAPTQEEVNRELDREIIAIATEQPAKIIPVRTSFTEEIGRAKAVRSQATNLVRNVMHDVRLGNAIHIDRAEEIVVDITDSILRNSGAMLSLMRIKSKDDYTFLHSVSVCTFLVAFCRSMGIDDETTRQAGLGGLLHDTGKALVPDEVLNKPGRLTDEEFEIIRKHPSDGYKILLEAPGISEIPLDITLHHHERVDGSGYPDKLAGDDIHVLAKMAAIVDVYDAITADRVYHKGVPATEALRKIFEWSKFHFDPALVKGFMRCVGIYPVGTLVMLESGRLGIVTEHNEDSLLQPTVKVIFDSKRMCYMPPQTIDLAKPMGRGGADKIVSHESASKWKVDISRFM